MHIRGHVRNGVVVLDGNPNLPEGAVVTVLSPAQPPTAPAFQRKHVPFPLVRSRHPGSVPLTNERIAEVSNEEEIPSRR